MKLQDIYQLAVEMGIEADPRGSKAAAKDLAKAQKQWDKMEEKDRVFFDQETLKNPYSDTRILYGDLDTQVENVLVGIDMEMPEILLADRLNEKGQKVDLVMAHHPEGVGLVGLHEVMHIQEGILADFGVPINVAEGILTSRISEVKRSLMPVNHQRPVDGARILNIPFMCVHTPADNLVTSFLQKLFDEKQPETLDDVVEILKEIPEYRASAQKKVGPTIIVGEGKKSAGKVFVDMTGGTGGSEDAFEKLAIAGVGTLVVMHIGEKHRKKAEENHINVVIAGHMASDSIGLNLFLDRLEKTGVNIIPVSGLIRHSRNE